MNAGKNDAKIDEDAAEQVEAENRDAEAQSEQGSNEGGSRDESAEHVAEISEADKEEASLEGFVSSQVDDADDVEEASGDSECEAHEPEDAAGKPKLTPPRIHSKDLAGVHSKTLGKGRHRDSGRFGCRWSRIRYLAYGSGEHRC